MPVASLVSIVLPTLREAANIPPLLAQIADAMTGRAYEVVVVDDDSRDGTDTLCAELSKTYPVRCITRVAPIDGLGGAVLLGLRETRGDVLVVMDADLQHPPSRLPALLAPIENDDAEFVVGSRTVAGGSTSGEWPVGRRLTSAVATALARPFAGNLKDVMSGYFALPRHVLERGDHLAPLGFKIGLELICKCRVKRLVEIPIHFGVRTAGKSKLDWRERFRYLEHLSRLYDFTYPRVVPAAKFLIVVIIGFFAGLGTYLALPDAIARMPASGCGYIVALCVTALFHRRYVRTQRHWLIRPKPWQDFGISALAELGAAALVATYVRERVPDPTWFDYFALPFAAATVVRYILRKELLLDVRGLRFMPALPIRTRSAD